MKKINRVIQYKFTWGDTLTRVVREGFSEEETFEFRPKCPMGRCSHQWER